MLQNIRDKSQGVLAWIVVIVIIATFALWGIHSYATSSKNPNIAAKVNGMAISISDVNASYERLRQQQHLQLGAEFSLNQAGELQLKKQALQQLIISNVLINSANHAGYRVTTNQVNEALLQIPAFQVNGQFSPDRFHEIVNSILYSQDAFLADMRESMLINQVQGGYVNSAFALPSDVTKAVQLVNQKRDISYVIIPAARFVHDVIVTPSEIQNYYASHQNEFQSPEQVRLEYIEVSLPAIKANLHFDQTKLQQYYENNLQNYTQPASWHVAQILIKVPQNATPDQIKAAMQKAQEVETKLQTGTDFASLAKQYSDDVASADKGGELPWFTAGSLDPAFEKAVASLQKEGDITLPIKTGYGFSIIKLLGEKKPQVLPFAQVTAQVQNALAEDQAEQAFADANDKLSNLTYANPDSLDVAAKTLDLPIQTTDFIDRQGTKEGITANPHVITAAFSSDVLQQNDNSDVIQIDPNNVVVVRVKDHKPAAVLPLSDVQDTIQTELLNKKAQQKAQQLGQQLIQQLQDRQFTPEKLARQYSLPWQVDENVGRYDSRVDAAILTQAFRLAHPTQSLVSAGGLALTSGDYALIIVNAVHEGVLQNTDTIQKRIFTEEVEKNFGSMDYELYVRRLMKNAKIKLNEDAFNNNGTDNSDDAT
jgi:peptidyl-prolyl cis-trans isomerase D